MVYSKRSNREACGDVHFFVRNGSHFSDVAEEGRARLRQSRRIFHIACINSHFVVFIVFIAFIAARRKEFTVQSGMFIAGEEPRRQT